MAVSGCGRTRDTARQRACSTWRPQPYIFHNEYCFRDPACILCNYSLSRSSSHKWSIAQQNTLISFAGCCWLRLSQRSSKPRIADYKLHVTPHLAACQRLSNPRHTKLVLGSALTQAKYNTCTSRSILIIMLMIAFSSTSIKQSLAFPISSLGLSSPPHSRH